MAPRVRLERLASHLRLTGVGQGRGAHLVALRSSSSAPLPYSKVLIANRGEIAVRVARACKDLGLDTVGIYAKEDAGSLHVQRVDEAVEVFSGKPGPIAPYLDFEHIVGVAKKTGAEAVHPGYGFLSESQEFAALCEREGIRFVGPRSETIGLLGDKVQARELALKNNVPILQGSPIIASGAAAAAFMKLNNISLPIIFKAAHGGGGRGMRLVRTQAELADSYDRCTSEARTAFGNGAVFFEEFMDEGRHIEVQVLADGQGGVVHLYERDCSVQIRNQKVVEVAPSRMHPQLRERILSCAVNLAKGCNYRGVGTVEFLLAGSLQNPDSKFVFMEVNPRIQVEHTITEEVTGVDLVKCQLKIAGGAKIEDLGEFGVSLGCENNAAAPLRGSAIQCRVSLAPGGGKEVTKYSEPVGEGIRVDAALYEGGQPSVHYDPLVGKLICFAPGEGGSDAAFQASRELSLRALQNYVIEGVNTNKMLMRGILSHPEFINNEVLLSFMARHGASLAKGGVEVPVAEAAAKPAAATFQKKEVSVAAPIEGVVIGVLAKEGAEVKEGDILVLLSAMKLETEVSAPYDGVVKRVCIGANDTVGSGQELVVLDALVPDVSAAAAARYSGNLAQGGRRLGASSFGAGVANATAVWYGAGSEVCEGATTTTLRLPAVRRDETFAKRKAHHEALIAELNERLEVVRAGGGERAVAQHRGRNKMLARERIEAVIDPGTTFMEIGALAAWDMYDGAAKSAGLAVGIGLVHGREVMFVANDATVKGGTYYPLTVKKHLRAQQIARENGLPCVYLVDSGGAYLPMQDEVFPDRLHFGRIFYNQAKMSSQGIPQVSVVLGSCTAGGAYMPAMSDENVIVKGNGTIFLGGPPLVKAATGEDVTPEELGGADVHTRISGVADHFAEDEQQALSICRDILAHTGDGPRPSAAPDLVPEAPLLDPEELLGIIPEDNAKAFDVRQVIGRIVDGSRFHEFKQRYGPTLVCGFAHIHGYEVGIVANNGILFSESALKGSHFIQLCGQRKIPLLFLQNITGFMIGKQYENGGIARDGAKMVNAVSCVDVPKLTVVIAGSHGAGNYGMCGRAYDPRFMFMWPNSRIGVMGGEQAAGVLTTVKQEQLKKLGKPEMVGEELEEFRRPTLEKYEKEGSPYYATARLWDDGVIDPRDTRQVLGRCLRISSRAPGSGAAGKFGVFRM